MSRLFLHAAGREGQFSAGLPYAGAYISFTLTSHDDRD